MSNSLPGFGYIVGPFFICFICFSQCTIFWKFHYCGLEHHGWRYIIWQNAHLLHRIGTVDVIIIGIYFLFILAILSIISSFWLQTICPFQKPLKSGYKKNLLDNSFSIVLCINIGWRWILPKSLSMPGKTKLA